MNTATSRNAPCPCGSGKRYKHCHGVAEAGADPPALLARALAEQRAGRLDSAESMYRRVLGEVPDNPDAYSEPIFVEDVRALVEHLEIQQAHLVGFSMGGSIVLNFALRYPRLCRSIVVVGAGSGTTNRERFEQDIDRTVNLLRSRGIEPYLKKLSDQLIQFLLGASAESPLVLLEDYRKKLVTHAVPVEELAKTEALSQNPDAYERFVAEGGKPRRAAAEAALQLTPRPRMGERVTYYVAARSAGR